MAATHSLESLHLMEVLVLTLVTLSLALAQDENGQFIYNDFREAKLHLDGPAYILHNGLLQLTSSKGQDKGYAFCQFPFKFKLSSSQSLLFSTNFVFALVPYKNGLSGDGIVFVISPSMDFSNALPALYIAIGLSENQLLAAVDLNHVGIRVNVNNMTTRESAPGAYFSNVEGKNKSLNLASGDPIQIWIDYCSAEKLLNVTLAPIIFPQKPSRPMFSTHLDLSHILLDSVYVGFSASTGSLVSTHYILGWSFNKSGQAQNLNILKLPELPIPDKVDYPKAANVPAKASHESSLKIIVWIVPVLVMLTTIIGGVYLQRKIKYEEIYEDWEREYGPQRFSYKTLYKATKGFKDGELIGNGGFGEVYKGVLPSPDIDIAVKRISHNLEKGMKGFVAEIVSLGRLRHRNLVRLHGYCRRKGELMLVYDYMPNGSLDKILYSNVRPELNWFQRFRIIRDIASSLLYLHEESEKVVIHRDIKPGNVLLDGDLNGKLGDFGLARLYDHGSYPQTTHLVGTIGYLAPELFKTGKGTTSSDVFAFGISMLEVACGRRPVEPQSLPEQENLVDWVINCWDRRAILDASDPKLDGSYAEEQMELILKLGLFCSHPIPAARPSMRQIVQFLDGDVKLPDIPGDSTMKAVFKASNEASFAEKSFFSFCESTSAGTISTDSTLTYGR